MNTTRFVLPSLLLSCFNKILNYSLYPVLVFGISKNLRASYKYHEDWCSLLNMFINNLVIKITKRTLL